jgi:hypothetical protein
MARRRFQGSTLGVDGKNWAWTSGKRHLGKKKERGL